MDKELAYTIRNIDPALWQAAKVRAAQDGMSLRGVILKLMAAYGSGDVVIAAKLATRTPARKATPTATEVSA